ncbi:MAG: hypothetical protein IPK60_25575 [Sandaracinaceae bacterium]|nr:hypothetical protein [Sandaracinaceae bacterium]
MATATPHVSHSESLAEHTVVVAGAGRDLERENTGPIIINWYFTSAGDDLFGRRSLFSALGNLDLQLRVPTEIAAGETSPLRVVVRDARTSALVAGARVEAMLIEPGATDSEDISNPVFAGETDAHGEARADVAMPAGVTRASIRVSVTSGNAHASSHRVQLPATK